jgi:ankyrin repeat protein
MSHWLWVIVLAVAAACHPPARAGDGPLADDYQSAQIAAIHHFVRQGELDHLKAVLDAHPRLVNSPERFRQPRKPVSSDGYSPLHWAAREGRFDVAAYLISRGADVNAADGAGWTPLHLAAREGHLVVVRVLVEHGARTDAKTAAVVGSVGVPPGSPAGATPQPLPAVPAQTPLDLAVAAGHAEVAEYLRSAGRPARDRGDALEDDPAGVRAKLAAAEAENRALRTEVARLKDELHKVPGGVAQEARLDTDLRLLSHLDRALGEHPEDRSIRADAAALAARLAPDRPGNRLVWGVLLKTGVLKDGMATRDAEKLLGPPTERSAEHAGWNFNPDHRRHVAPYLHARLTKDGLSGWKLDSR